MFIWLSLNFLFFFFFTCDNPANELELIVLCFFVSPHFPKDKYVQVQLF